MSDPFQWKAEGTDKGEAQSSSSEQQQAALDSSASQSQGPRDDSSLQAHLLAHDTTATPEPSRLESSTREAQQPSVSAAFSPFNHQLFPAATAAGPAPQDAAAPAQQLFASDQSKAAAAAPTHDLLFAGGAAPGFLSHNLFQESSQESSFSQAAAAPIAHHDLFGAAMHQAKAPPPMPDHRKAEPSASTTTGGFGGGVKGPAEEDDDDADDDEVQVIGVATAKGRTDARDGAQEMDYQDDPLNRLETTGKMDVDEDDVLFVGNKNPNEQCGEEAKKKTEDPPENSKEWRRRRRKRLRRVFKRSKGNPSFVALLTTNYDVSDDEEFEREVEQQVQRQQQQIIQQPQEQVIVIAPQGGEPPPLPKRIRVDLDAALGLKGPNAPSIIPIGPVEVEPGRLNPADEGWYEGTVPMALPEDAEYSSPQMQFIRQNLEYFSATETDLSIPSAGRRAALVRGRVGIRCMHCAKAPDGSVRTTGAVSYPVNISGIHSMCSQKIQLHFEKCPNLPDDRRMQLEQLVQRAANSQHRSRRSYGGIPSALYTVISARRIGLTDVGGSIRFSRDLSLDPLPFETIRMQVQNEQSGLSAASALVEPRITADAESERVLAEAVAESDDDPNSKALCKVEDKSLVTDYFFLAVKQMKICLAVPGDFNSRGKISRSLRVGFAGFCCRWCDTGAPTGAPMDSSCRCFTSAKDGLSSAISNSFNSHLQKCPRVPSRIKSALSAYKRIHSRQMAQLPHGSQQRLIRELWSRLRAADKSEEEMQDLIDQAPAPILSDWQGTASAKETSNLYASDTDNYERPPSFPVCEDWETNAILEKALTDWDPTISDNLLIPSDRRLISDYVFLAMRQLTLVVSDETDSPRLRRGQSAGAYGLAGIGCIHCANRNVSSSGRSFPSAPDNFASALNTALYNHMQACQYVAEDLKRALANLRKLHSAQCSSLRFGSQRRFFKLLFDRLRKFSNKSLGNNDEKASGTGTSTSSNKEALSRHGFIHVPAKDQSESLFMCKRCRMVPIQFRAANSIFLKQPSIDLLRQHSLRCKQDSFDLTVITDALDEMIRSKYKDDTSLLNRDSFKAVIRAAVGDHESLSTVFTDDVANLLSQRRASRTSVDFSENKKDHLRSLWNDFPTFVDFSKVATAFKTFAEEVGAMSTDLRNHPAMIQYLLLISPSLVVPDPVGEEGSDSPNTPVSNVGSDQSSVALSEREEVCATETEQPE